MFQYIKFKKTYFYITHHIITFCHFNHKHLAREILIREAITEHFTNKLKNISTFSCLCKYCFTKFILF